MSVYRCDGPTNNNPKRKTACGARDSRLLNRFGGVRGRTELPGYVDRYMAGQIHIDELVTHQMPLADINRAFDLMHEGASIRAVITF